MNKNIEMMKKVIEEKKKASAKNPIANKSKKSIGQTAKGRRSKKGGGLFDR